MKAYRIFTFDNSQKGTNKFSPGLNLEQNEIKEFTDEIGIIFSVESKMNGLDDFIELCVFDKTKRKILDKFDRNNLCEQYAYVVLPNDTRIVHFSILLGSYKTYDLVEDEVEASEILYVGKQYTLYGVYQGPIKIFSPHKLSVFSKEKEDILTIAQYNGLQFEAVDTYNSALDLGIIF